MKTRIRMLLNDLNDYFTPSGRKKQNEIRPEKESYTPEGVLLPCNQEVNNEYFSDSDQHALKMRSKGIFACPHFSKFFEGNDDIRIE